MAPTGLATVAALVVSVIASGALFWGAAARRRAAAETLLKANAESDRVLRQAERDADSLRKEAALEAREKAHEIAADAERQVRDRRQEIVGLEQILADKTRSLADRLAATDRLEQDLRAREKATASQEERSAAAAARAEQLVADRHRELQRVAGLSADEARELLLKQMEADARRDAANMIKRLETEARETAAMRAQEIIADAIQRSAAEHAIETTVSVVDLPSDDMKGRIIGREGRNIRALELHTGVDLIVDDTPGAIILSSFDPFRREVARRAIERLIADGRIHPARIEEVVLKVKQEMEQHIKEEGDKACFELGVHSLHPELVKLVGRMKYRTSYGQNCLQHSKEVAWLAGMMASEIGADSKLAKRMGLLHDIGKALTHEQEGSHPELSLQVLTKYGESPQIINAALCGHENVEPETIEAVLTEAADGISAARPGARRDVLESYIKRLAKLEEIAMSYKGVEMCYAIQAGRELRIMTKADQISDLDAHQLAKDISKRIEAEMQYPGHIKVIVIRETRAVEVAK